MALPRKVNGAGHPSHTRRVLVHTHASAPEADGQEGFVKCQQLRPEHPSYLLASLSQPRLASSKI